MRRRNPWRVRRPPSKPAHRKGATAPDRPPGRSRRRLPPEESTSWSFSWVGEAVNKQRETRRRNSRFWGPCSGARAARVPAMTGRREDAPSPLSLLLDRPTVFSRPQSPAAAPCPQTRGSQAGPRLRRYAAPVSPIPLSDAPPRQMNPLKRAEEDRRCPAGSRWPEHPPGAGLVPWLNRATPARRRYRLRSRHLELHSRLELRNGEDRPRRRAAKPRPALP